MQKSKRALQSYRKAGHIYSSLSRSVPDPKESSEQKRWIRTGAWSAFPGLIHGFSRRLPKSFTATSIGASLDAPDCPLHTLTQVHGNTIVQIGGEEATPGLEADGMLTTEQNVLLGIKTADCVPLLLVAPHKWGVGALHAGWRGTQKTIALRAVELCAERWDVSPTQLWVALGPSIGGCCYQVGSEIGEPLFERWGDGQPTTWNRHGDKGYLDLRAINRMQLIQAGVPQTQIHSVGPCTFCHPDEFTSYRRERAQAGRQLSVIGWCPN